MTYAEIDNEVTLITGPVSLDVIALIRKIENEYIEETKCTEKVTEYSVITASLAATYSLTTILTSSYPFVKEHRIEWDGLPLYPMHKKTNLGFYDSDDEAYTGYPANYMIENDTLRIIPEPMSAGTLRIWFSYRNSATDGASPIIPVNEHKNLTDGVIGKILKTPDYRDYNLATYHDGVYAVNSEKSRLEHIRRRSTQSRITDTCGMPGDLDLNLRHEGADGWSPIS